MLNAKDAVGALAFLAAAAGIAYTAFAIKRVRQFRNSARHQPCGFTPPVTVFKPLHGDEPHLYENLRSFCDQEYPDFQIIFGANDSNDPALDVARRLQREFTGRDIAVVAGAPARVRNEKDRMTRAGRDYLREVVAPFAGDGVGAVTCIYGGTPNPSTASQLGAMHVNDHFAPSVLVATGIEPLTYCFGATMAVRREILENAGGFDALGDRLGDDYALGRLVAASGHRVELSRYVVHTTIADDDLETLWLHELRWARTIFSQRPAGFAGSIVTYALPLAIAFAALAPSALAFFTLTVAAVLRTILHFEGRKTFAPDVRATPWLIPVRDLLSVAVWVTAFLGKRVRWRNSRFEVKAGGQMAGTD